MSEEQLFQIIANEVNLNLVQVRNTISLLDDDNTVPFISRYRKEKTGSLDEEQIRHIEERIRYLRAVISRKETILRSITEQGKLTPQLQQKIESTFLMQELEDLYLPYRPKKKTRALLAKEKGLDPLAQIILAQELMSGDVLDICKEYVNAKKNVRYPEDALSGAKDIVAEIISENAKIRKDIRELMNKSGMITTSSKSANEKQEYEMYADYTETVAQIPPHRILAINRGENQKALSVDIDVNPDVVNKIIENEYITNNQSIFIDIIKDIIHDAYNRLIAPAVKREIRSALTEKAEKHAIGVFAINLQNLLLQPPLKNKRIMGIDPGYRTGCKVAIIDETGKYITGDTIYPHPPQKKYFEAKSRLREFIDKYHTQIIAIGNGTASRETELMIADLIKEIKNEHQVFYTIVSEAGASVYSASAIAKEEFPDLEASLRGNISIARRLQDPLAELVKIDPKSLGVGLYQHDVQQKRLAEKLDEVIESCVNLVGVDLNTASKALLTHISGLNKRSAENIVSYRDKMGKFKNREELKEVEGIGDSVFEQSSGFLRISHGDNPLDATSIHPESYSATNKLLRKFSINDPISEGKMLKSKLKSDRISLQEIANEIGIGQPTLEDILDTLEKPDRDPRDEMDKPVFRSDVLKIEDLKEEMILKGTVRNVVDFGAFVDIGVKQDGLIHISQMNKGYVKSPYEILQVGDVIEIRVLSIDLDRGRIALSMKR
jgi:uncharacterized protein